MAITATSQTVFDGERVAIMKFYFTTTDTTGETNVVKVNPASLSASAAGGACDAVTIQKITALTHGLEVQMSWDATTPVVIETIPQNTQYHTRLFKHWWTCEQCWNWQDWQDFVQHLGSLVQGMHTLSCLK
jgi:TPP-dependent trihydroxycyclohexane-1,2-dione (THcHDO) dehydratase